MPIEVIFGRIGTNPPSASCQLKQCCDSVFNPQKSATDYAEIYDSCSLFG